ncbi:MAG: hypothetical protein V2I82_01285 [Halieaceae bacterium]|jgi:hypothetical protein|nr:hypothetical protein [Halieaceae bacterium]
MSDAVFVIRNQLQQFWTRAGDWVDGREPQRVLKFKHRDEALNQLVELSARDIELRGEVLSCELSARGEPVVEASEHPTPLLAEIAAAKAAERAAEKAAEKAAEAATEDDSDAAAENESDADPAAEESAAQAAGEAAAENADAESSPAANAATATTPTEGADPAGEPPLRAAV